MEPLSLCFCRFVTLKRGCALKDKTIGCVGLHKLIGEQISRVDQVLNGVWSVTPPEFDSVSVCARVGKD